MELSAALFDEITGLSELPPASDEAEHERRQHYRMPIGSRATIVPIVKGVEQAPCSVMIRDMSVGSVGILLAHPFRQGDQFSVLFPGKGTRTIKIKCVTQRCEAGGVGGTQYIVGATFLEMTTTAEPAPTQAAPRTPEPAPAIKLPPSRPSGIFASSKPLEVKLPVGIPEPTDAHPAPILKAAPARVDAPTPEEPAVKTVPVEIPAIETPAAKAAVETTRAKSPAEEDANSFPDLAAVRIGFETQPEPISEEDLMSALLDPTPSHSDLEGTPMPNTTTPTPVSSTVEPIAADESPAAVAFPSTPSSAAPRPAHPAEPRPQPAADLQLQELEQMFEEESPEEEAPAFKASQAAAPAHASQTPHAPDERPAAVAAPHKPAEQPMLRIAPETRPQAATSRPAPAAPLNAAQAGKNQEVLAKVKARLLNQNQVLQHNAGELEKTQKQLADQAKLCEEARQQSGQLKAQYTAAEHRWVQEREKISQQVKALSAEAVLLKQQIQTLQLKSVSDDQAIAELSALLTGDAAPSAPTRTETAEAA